MRAFTFLLAFSCCLLSCNGQLSPFEETLAAIRFADKERLSNNSSSKIIFRATSTTTERVVPVTTAATDAVEVEDEQEVKSFSRFKI